MTTMDERYGDGSDHIACDKCGQCIECGDCKCNSFKETKPWSETDHVELTIQIDGFPYCVKTALSEESIKNIKSRIRIPEKGIHLNILSQSKELNEVILRIYELMKDRIR